MAQGRRAVGLGGPGDAGARHADNVGLIVREGDIVLLAVDNHPTRALVDRHVATLRDATLISGGNDETDGNVQLVRRRDGYGRRPPGRDPPGDRRGGRGGASAGPGCQVLAAERPQLLVTNLMVASAMLNALWAVIEHGSVPYSEVYLDVVQLRGSPATLVPPPGGRAVGGVWSQQVHTDGRGGAMRRSPAEPSRRSL